MRSGDDGEKTFCTADPSHGDVGLFSDVVSGGSDEKSNSARVVGRTWRRDWTHLQGPIRELFAWNGKDEAA